MNDFDACSFNQHENVSILPISKTIYGYRSTEPLPVICKFQAEVKSSMTGHSKVTQFCIVDGSDGNLIGCETASDLGLLHIINNVSIPTDNIMKEYKCCFEGLGKMKGKTAKLHIDDSFKPLAQKYRRLPFHIGDQVEAELKKLKDQPRGSLR